jgi:hypothetical protein
LKSPLQAIACSGDFNDASSFLFPPTLNHGQRRLKSFVNFSVVTLRTSV